jgi:hypothetical protein
LATIRVGDVEEHEPRHIALESFLDNGNASHVFLIERAEKCGASFEYGSEKPYESFDAFWTAAFRRPSRNLDVNWATCEFAGSSLKEGVDMFGTIDFGDNAKAIGRQSLYLNHQHIVPNHRPLEARIAAGMLLKL